MEEVFKDPVQLSKGINLKELMDNKQIEFQIDTDFKKKKGMLINADEDLFPDMDDDDESDSEDVFKNLEKSVEGVLLASPEYHSFDQLSPKMVDCVSNGHVKLLIIEEGDGPLVPVDAEVTMHYAAYWERAKIPFDSTLSMNRGKPLRIRLGVGKVLPGLEIALSHVKGPSARFHVLLAPEAAWGPRGVPPRIKPETALFIISLYDVRHVHAATRFNDLPTAEQAKYQITIKTIKDIREEGKDLFSRRKYKHAIKSYQQAMSVLSVSRPENDKEESEINDLRVKIYMNLAVCYHKVGKPKYVLGMCENIDRYIDINNHCKALFYSARAYENLGKIDDAIEFYKKALKLEPKNKEIGAALAELDLKSKKGVAEEKKMWRKALKSDVVDEKAVYTVDEDFLNGVREMCEDLSSRVEYAKFDLPTGLTKDEMACIKSLANEFQCLKVLEDGEGRKKKVSIVKTV